MAVRGIAWGRPRQAGAALLSGCCGERFVIGDATGHRAQDVERVERQHPRPGLGRLHPWIREPEPLRRRADREPQQQPLRPRPILLQQEPGVERHAHLLVQEHRVFARLLRKHALRQARHEHDPERPSASLVRTADEDCTVPGARGGSDCSVSRRSASTSRASCSAMGPISLMGRSSPSIRRTSDG